MNNKEIRYMNPITFEAEIFVNNFESLSKTYHQIDSVLLSSLEKVMDVVGKFLDSNHSEIVATDRTKLVKCNDIDHIKRIFTCTACKQDLGKSAEKATHHIIADCTKTCLNKIDESANSHELELENLRTALRGTETRKKKKQPGDYPVKLNKKTRCLLTRDLTAFIDDFSKMSAKLKCLPVYDVIVNDMASLVKPLFPNKSVKIYKFGSRISGTGTRESDLDLYIDIGDTFNVHQQRVNVDTLLKMNRVANALKNSNSWKNLVKIERARVPILKIYHVASGIECDINFSNSLGTINTKYLEFIFNLQPIANLLCIFMKKWLQCLKFNEEISTYSMNLMVLFYLQTLQVLPSMQQLQQNINEEKALKVGPWLCTYATLSLGELKIMQERLDQPNLLKFIRGFFLFYINLNFNRDIICPYLGVAVKKTEFENLMPERYKKLVNSSRDCALELDKPVVVQDPIQLNHNTTKNLKEFIFKTLKSYMIHSLDVIHENYLF